MYFLHILLIIKYLFFSISYYLYGYILNEYISYIQINIDIIYFNQIWFSIDVSPVPLNGRPGVYLIIYEFI